jgi:predicted transcriptional regulator
MQKHEPSTPDRSRLSVELSPVISSHLDHISEITGQSKAAIVSACLVESMPDILARADALKKRFQELSQAKSQRR